jgi:hypothetical protein
MGQEENANPIQALFMALIKGLLVPAILLGVLALAFVLANVPVSISRQFTSKHIALILGFVLFALVVVIHQLVGSGARLSWTFSRWWYVLISPAAIFVGLLMVPLVTPSSLQNSSALFVALLAWASLTAFYFYCAVGYLRNFVAVCTIGLLCGILLYLVLHPEMLSQFSLK